MQNRILIVMLGLAASLILSLGSCSAEASMVLKETGDASVSINFGIPGPVELKLRNLASTTGGIAAAGSFFDAKAVESGLLNRGLIVKESRSPDARSYSGAFEVKNLAAFIQKDPELSKAGILSFSREKGWAEVQIRITRINSRALVNLFPSVDRQLLESLSPPALFDLPVSKENYRSMLAALLGKTAIEAIDASNFVLSITVPGPILESDGGVVKSSSNGRIFVYTLPVLDAMTLERTITMRIRWKE